MDPDTRVWSMRTVHDVDFERAVTVHRSLGVVMNLGPERAITFIEPQGTQGLVSGFRRTEIPARHKWVRGLGVKALDPSDHKNPMWALQDVDETA